MFLEVGLAMLAFSILIAGGVTRSLRTEAPVALDEEAEPVAATKGERKTNKKYDFGKKLDLDEPEEEPGKAPERRSEAKALPVQAAPWPRPSRTEAAAAAQPRRFQPQQDARLTLTVGARGLQDVPAINSNTCEALGRGVIHLPQTPMPWEEKEQKNVYLAGHRVGYPGTGSHLVFYNLDQLKKGHAVTLKDGSGTSYEPR